jgi:hypothetical protein
MIMESKKILTNKTRKKMGICIKGQGDCNRVFGPSSISLEDKNYYKKYDEASGSYFRVDFATNSNKHKNYNYINSFGDVCLVFSKNLLEKTDWILNTTENFGFYINSLGVIGKSSYTGYKGKTYDYSNIEKFPCKNTNISENDTELLIKNDIGISCLEKVIFKTKYIYKKYKHMVPKNVESRYVKTM